MKGKRMAVVSVEKAWSLPRKRVLRRVMQSDPGQEYFVYIPASGGNDAPLLVAVHGISRNVRELVKSFAPYAEKAGVVLVAPHFAPERHPDYQRLGRSGRGPRADATLAAIVEEAAWVTGAATAQIHLFGYSGGAQFAHRYVMAYPQRVAGVVIGAAGWYTFPDPKQRFPYGIGPSRDLTGVSFDPEEFLRIPITVVVGERDTTQEGLRRTKRADRQGQNRVERARHWVDAMHAAAQAYRLEPRVVLELVDGGEHSFQQAMQRDRLGDRVFKDLFGLPMAFVEDGGNGKG